MNNLSLRIGSGILMILLIAWGYWWLILIAACAFLFIYPSYYEILLWGVIVDALYASPYQAHIAFIFAAILLFISIFFKKRLAFYS